MSQPASLNLELPATVARRTALPGRLRKQLRVPERRVAIVLAEAGPYTLEPGEHSLPNWPAPAPEVILVDAGPLPFDLQWDALPAGDGDPVTLTAGLEVTVADPLRLHATWLRTGPGPEWPLPADAVAGRLHERIGQWMASYAAADLGRRAVQDGLVQELRELLAPELSRYGLQMAAPALNVRCLTQAERTAALAAARAARELAQDARLGEMLQRLDDQDMFLDRIRTWEARTSAKLDDATIASLWRQVAPGGLPLPRSELEAIPQAALPDEAARSDEAASAARTVLEKRAGALEAAAPAAPLAPQRRFEQQLARLDAPARTLPDSPSDTLNRLYRGLRLGAATVGVAWALRAVLSQGFDPNNLPGLLLEGLGLAVAVVGVAAAAVTYRQAQTQAAPYWKVIQDQIAGLPAGARLAAARTRARRLNLAADALILVALAAGLLLWLGRQPDALLALPVLAFMTAFALVLVARRGEQAARRQVDALVTQVAHPTVPERRTADDLVRRRVAGYLERTGTNLEEAGRALFRLGPAGQDVSAPLRRLRTGPLEKLRAEAQEMHYRDARYFASAWAPDAQVVQMLDLDDDLLRRAQKLALDSEALYAAGADGDVGTSASAVPALDKDVNQLRRVLGERSAFIGGINQ